MIPVLVEDVPVIRIPDKPRFEGMHLYLQVYMHNEAVYPEDPYKMSNGLDVTIGSPAPCPPPTGRRRA